MHIQSNITVAEIEKEIWGYYFTNKVIFSPTIYKSHSILGLFAESYWTWEAEANWLMYLQMEELETVWI